MAKMIWKILLVGTLCLIPTTLCGIEDEFAALVPSTTLAIKGFHIRLLILKHSPGQEADTESDLALRAVKSAVDKGLKITTIGNRDISYAAVQLILIEASHVESLINFLTTGTRLAAVPGDTLIILTIGHGLQSGELEQLGQRSEILKIFAKAATEARQRTIWWQVSCYANAKLPSIQSLPPEQQQYISVVASSSANQETEINIQEKVMEKLLNALATHSKTLDKKQNNIITAQEVKDFLNNVSPKRGDLFFAKSPDQPIFRGLQVLAQLIPVKDRNNPQREYKEEYILLPRD